MAVWRHAQQGHLVSLEMPLKYTANLSTYIFGYLICSVKAKVI